MNIYSSPVRDVQLCIQTWDGATMAPSPVYMNLGGAGKIYECPGGVFLFRYENAAKCGSAFLRRMKLDPTLQPHDPGLQFQIMRTEQPFLPVILTGTFPHTIEQAGCLLRATNY
jgi:hypothetical protein